MSNTQALNDKLSSVRFNHVAFRLEDGLLHKSDLVEDETDGFQHYATVESYEITSEGIDDVRALLADLQHGDANIVLRVERYIASMLESE